MDIKKMVPWNWFKKEQEQEVKSFPVRRSDTKSRYSHPLARIHDEINRLFDDFFKEFSMPGFDFYGDMTPVATGEWLKPTLDIAETDKEYTISVELPGVSEKDINLELIDDTLKISGEKKQEKEEKEKNYYSMERSYGAFQRVLSLPEDADRDNIQAAYKNGIMTIKIPRKADSESNAKRIEIKGV